MSRPKKKPSNHYVDNKQFYEEMSKYHQKYLEATEAGEEPPKASNYIGKCLLLIAEGVSHNRNFIGYTYREEMVGDAVENCIRYLHNFNPEKSKNPFAYFSQISYFAFLRRIEKEKKQSYVRWKSIENCIINNTLVEMPNEDQTQFVNMIASMDYDKLATLSEKFEKKPKKPKAKDSASLDKFVE